MINIELIVILLIAHWIGDYLLQFNIIAINKSSDLLWLTVHVLIYTGVIFLAIFLKFSSEQTFYFCAINGVLHFATDFVTSKLSSKYKGQPRIFFPIIGFDQLVHTLTLLTTAHYII